MESEALLLHLDRLYEATMAKDKAAIRGLLRMRIATHLPREVREELLAGLQLPADSLRAPIRLLQFRHRMIELAREDRSTPAGQLELDLRRPRTATPGSPPAVRRATRARVPRGSGGKPNWKRRKGE